MDHLRNFVAYYRIYASAYTGTDLRKLATMYCTSVLVLWYTFFFYTALVHTSYTVHYDNDSTELAS